MNHVQIFQPNEEMAMVAAAGDKIVDALSNNYVAIIGGMVGKSPNTRKTYQRNVEHFLAFIQTNGINSNSFGAYREALADVSTVAVKTKNAYMAATAALLRESLKYGILPVDITANVPAFKVSRGHVKDGLSENEVATVRQYINGLEDERTRLMLSAIFHLFALEGLRQAEVQQLRVKDINCKDGHIMIKGKGRHEREKFYVMAATLAAVCKYMDGATLTSGWLFPSPKNADEPVALRSIRRYFTCPKYGIFTRCGITGKSVHGFRHYNITKTLKITGGDMAKTRRRSRHAGFEMLVVYDDERLSKADVAELERHFNA